jgi:hypothetical protein
VKFSIKKNLPIKKFFNQQSSNEILNQKKISFIKEKISNKKFPFKKHIFPNKKKFKKRFLLIKKILLLLKKKNLYQNSLPKKKSSFQKNLLMK